MDQSITLWSIFKLRGGIVMKLIFKDGQELVITRANDTYSYEGYKVLSSLFSKTKFSKTSLLSSNIFSCT